MRCRRSSSSMSARRCGCPQTSWPRSMQHGRRNGIASSSGRRLGVKYNAAKARILAEEAIRAAAQTKDNPADLINVALDMLIRQGCELPGYTTLDEATKTIRTQVNRGLFTATAARIGPAHRAGLERLMVADPATRRSAFDALKAPPKAATLGRFKERLQYMLELDALGPT